jgi:hypothetical protein
MGGRIEIRGKNLFVGTLKACVIYPKKKIKFIFLPLNTVSSMVKEASVS